MFQGFAPETVDFLWEIRMNNNREWFTAHKEDYVKYLYEPMKALGAELFEPFAQEPGNFLKVSRIYRDARPHHPLPYKEGLWLSIRRPGPWEGENPCLYFEIVPERVSYGFFLWKPKPATQEVYRQRLLAEPRPFLEMVQTLRENTGLELTAPPYKRPKVQTDIPELAPYLAFKSEIACDTQIPMSEAVFGPELKDRVAELFRELRPLYHFFNSVCNP